MAKKAALGKGLEALLGNELGDLKQGVRYVSDTPYGMEQGQTAEKEAGNGETPGQMIREIPVSQIEPNPFQPRKEFDEEALSELASSIKTLGLIYENTEFGKHAAAEAQKAAKKINLEIVADVPFNNGATNLNSEVNKNIAISIVR